MSADELHVPCQKCNHELAEIIRMQVCYKAVPGVIPGDDRMIPDWIDYELRCRSSDCGHTFSHRVAPQ